MKRLETIAVAFFWLLFASSLGCAIYGCQEDQGKSTGILERPEPNLAVHEDAPVVQ